MQTVCWTAHAQLRFAEKAAKYGINYGDIEMEVVRQKVRLREPGKDKFKTIFKVLNCFLTVVKVERKNLVHVLTLWESNENEVNKWRKTVK
ncbi:MAG TPA: hypothetical protein HA252_00980 [Candidatus Diapherotrites archaeon]|uniref:DUF4258 domain-containing protein n=1 Tax=Candidatus Iainarchaeum sp. TaxID=3101447 RepID=A0A7J4JHC3_9ARCH|nr:hypothetical protein [Candidatus Diapherotrites archaeon]HIH15959.1 hypothetical protein [Candidatus Diapherotrites archaeon]